jgi:hypothetical protein
MQKPVEVDDLMRIYNCGMEGLLLKYVFHGWWCAPTYSGSRLLVSKRYYASALLSIITRASLHYIDWRC